MKTQINPQVIFKTQKTQGFFEKPRKPKEKEKENKKENKKENIIFFFRKKTIAACVSCFFLALML